MSTQIHPSLRGLIERWDSIFGLTTANDAWDAYNGRSVPVHNSKDFYGIAASALNETGQRARAILVLLIPELAWCPFPVRVAKKTQRLIQESHSPTRKSNSDYQTFDDGNVLYHFAADIVATMALYLREQLPQYENTLNAYMKEIEDLFSWHSLSEDVRQDMLSAYSVRGFYKDEEYYPFVRLMESRTRGSALVSSANAFMQGLIEQGNETAEYWYLNGVLGQIDYKYGAPSQPAFFDNQAQFILRRLPLMTQHNFHHVIYNMERVAKAMLERRDNRADYARELLSAIVLSPLWENENHEHWNTFVEIAYEAFADQPEIERRLHNQYTSRMNEREIIKKKAAKKAKKEKALLYALRRPEHRQYEEE